MTLKVHYDTVMCKFYVFVHIHIYKISIKLEKLCIVAFKRYIKIIRLL